MKRRPLHCSSIIAVYRPRIKRLLNEWKLAYQCYTGIEKEKRASHTHSGTPSVGSSTSADLAEATRLHQRALEYHRYHADDDSIDALDREQTGLSVAWLRHVTGTNASYTRVRE